MIDAYIAVEEDEKPVEYVLFKTERKILEINLKADYEIQKTINNLIDGLEKDVKIIEKYPEIIDKIIQIQTETETSKEELDEKIDVKKEDLSEKIEE